jgi:hypothetical protein
LNRRSGQELPTAASSPTSNKCQLLCSFVFPSREFTKTEGREIELVRQGEKIEREREVRERQVEAMVRKRMRNNSTRKASKVSHTGCVTIGR